MCDIVLLLVGGGGGRGGGRHTYCLTLSHRWHITVYTDAISYNLYIILGAVYLSIYNSE